MIVNAVQSRDIMAGANSRMQIIKLLHFNLFIHNICMRFHGCRFITCLKRRLAGNSSCSRFHTFSPARSNSGMVGCLRAFKAFCGCVTGLRNGFYGLSDCDSLRWKWKMSCYVIYYKSCPSHTTIHAGNNIIATRLVTLWSCCCLLSPVQSE